MTQMYFSRRTLLGSLAALPILTQPALAKAPIAEPLMAQARRFKLGAFDVTTVLAATRAVPDPHGIFGLNVSADEFTAVSEAANIPADVSQFFFTPTVVNTGTELVLFDTGLDAGGITGALAAAGYTPEQVDVVVLTHMHPDHIGGLSGDAGPTFPNARYVTGTGEFDFWAAQGSEIFDAKMRPLADKTTMIKGGDSVASGITAIEAFGHTPGHMVYRVDSLDKPLLIAADFANHYVWSLAHPDWEVKFDMDKSAAATTRKALLDMLATEQMPFIGYHMPWPGIGYVARRGDSYAYEAASYQQML